MADRKTILIIVGVMTLAAAIAVAIAVPLTVNSKSTNPKSTKEPAYAPYLENATALLNTTPLIDGHNDLTTNFRYTLQNRISDIDLHDDMRNYFSNSHTDITRMRQGRMGAQFWSCFVSCSAQHVDAVRQALEQIDVMKRMIDMYPDEFQAAYTADDIEAAFSAGKIASVIGVEGGHMIDSSMAALRILYELGTRYMTLTHSCDTPWCDAANGEYPNGGLTEFGKEIVLEMNRLGMMVDLAHVSTDVMRQAIEVSRAPIIFSHSSVRALCDVERNVPDDVLQSLVKNEGIIMINFFTRYTSCEDTGTLQDVADHYDYVKNLTGSRYLGVGADYDGVPYTPVELEDTSTYPNLFAELMRRGWTDDELRDVAGRNLLRVMRGVEQVARDMANETPQEDWVPPEDVADVNCRSTF